MANHSNGSSMNAAVYSSVVLVIFLFLCLPLFSYAVLRALQDETATPDPLRLTITAISATNAAVATFVEATFQARTTPTPSP
jgi:hypothetical protein